ncbi:MAG: DUF4124 domain-containing protein [Betaproteobacteria bacterium]
MRRTLVLLSIVVTPLSALGETCKYVDKDGHTIYSNVTIKNARKLNCFQPPEPVAPEPKAPSAAGKPRSQEGVQAAPIDGGRPKVEPTTQRKRDDQRRQILEDELAREQNSLAESRKVLSEQEAIRNGDERNYQRVLDRLKPYQDDVAVHEKNVSSIRQELANLK